MRRQVGHLTSEGEYFHQLDVDLIEKMRRRAALEERRRRMAEAAQINDPNTLEALEKLGYNPATVSLLYLVPLVQVAWANGAVSDAERHQVLAMASLHGVKVNTPAYEQLVEWLDQPPAAEFCEGTLRVIQAVLESLPQNERQARQRALTQCCVDVAAASGRHLEKIGVAERKLLERIEEQLELHQNLAASAGV